MTSQPSHLFARQALLPEGWAQNVLISIGGDGIIAAVARDAEYAETAEHPALDILLPGMGNCHSHAFHAALRGLVEKRSAEHPNNSFWTWRESMYAFANTITPEQMEALAAGLYGEMLKAGYTGVGEFHYIHHQPDGAAYQPATEMSDSIIAAAEKVGIAITHIPILYQHGGFKKKDGTEEIKENSEDERENATDGQRRFLNDTKAYIQLVKDLQTKHSNKPNVSIAMGVHSLRAATPAMMEELLKSDLVTGSTMPIHLHIAEQEGEVKDCVKATGKRPVEWLLDFLERTLPAFDQKRLTLIHATHMTDKETAELAKRGICIGFCPTTEANLGDGISQAKAYAEQGGHYSIGSDQNGIISPFMELYMLEHAQRLQHHERIVLGDGDRLYKTAAAGGAQSLGTKTGAIAVGNRADLVSIDPAKIPSLFGYDKKPEKILDVLALNPTGINPVNHVWVRGVQVVHDGHLQAPEVRKGAALQANVKEQKSAQFESEVEYGFQKAIAELQSIAPPPLPGEKRASAR